MNCRGIFIVVPSLKQTGLVKGAVALCNGLSEFVPVTLVSLKISPCKDIELRSRVKVIFLAQYKGWKKKHDVYRKVLTMAGDRTSLVSISLGFSADIFNLFLKPYAVTVSSVRGNLIRNYRFDYGTQGTLAGIFHYMMLRHFDKVIAMSSTMEQQLRRFGIQNIATVGNFIDEPFLEYKRLERHSNCGPIRFLFMASLSKRKRPELLLNAMRSLKEKGIECYLDIVGEGPLCVQLQTSIEEWNLKPLVTFYGQMDDPYIVLQKADWLILPSESEGISRAMLEALFFGVPCVARDIDANRDLIKPGVNGELFARDEELFSIMANIAQGKSRIIGSKTENLLPDEFRQKKNIQLFWDIINSLK